jgi:hypothetical protein
MALCAQKQIMRFFKRLALQAFKKSHDLFDL